MFRQQQLQDEEVQALSRDVASLLIRQPAALIPIHLMTS